MEAVIIMAVCALSNVLCFLIGARTGMAVAKGETIELPAVKTAESYQQKKAREEAELEQKRIETILRNIENYNGTPYGQEDVPKG